MDGVFWTSYGVFAGIALGLGGMAIGILIARARLGDRLTANLGTAGLAPHDRR